MRKLSVVHIKLRVKLRIKLKTLVIRLEHEHLFRINCTANFAIFSNNEESDPIAVETTAGFVVLDKQGNIDELQLSKATDQILERNCSSVLNCDNHLTDGSMSELDERLVKFALENTIRTENRRLEMPLFWNSGVCHLLPSNQNLALAILNANLKKLSRNKNLLKLMNESIKEQQESGVVEKIDNLEQYLKEHPEHSFLPHMGIFRLNRETTKCRVVFLSNLCQDNTNGKISISHNQAMYSGPSLNQKISTALLNLRFDSYLLCFDLKKAFSQISLREEDSNKLLFLWYRNVDSEDFSLVAYKNVRLPFGLRCSPTLLMLALYKILVLDADTEIDSKRMIDLKLLLYQCFYMDNGAVSAENCDALEWAFSQLKSIFNPYKFDLQQFMTNDHKLQAELDE